MKPVVKIYDASIFGATGNQFMYGRLVEYPENHGLGNSLNGQIVQTSTIVSIHDNVVETKNTIYEVQSWENQ